MKKLQPFVKYGIIYGVISICILLFTFHVYYFGMIMQTILSFALLIVFHYFTAKAYKNQNGGYLSYGETFKYLFIMSAVGFAISTIYTIVYMNYINPDAVAFLNENREMLLSFGMNDVVTKPFNPDNFYKVIANQLSSI